MDTATKNRPDEACSLQDIVAKQAREIRRQQQRITVLEEYIRLQHHRQFGRSSEKAPGQGELFDEAELLAEEGALPAEEESISEKGPSKPDQKSRGRKPLPVELPRIRVEHDLTEAEKTCPCGGQRTLIGEETSEQLDIIPAKIQVLVQVRKKYACKHCEEGIQLAPLPPQPIPKSNASAGLLAHIAIAKYQDALPLYRQEQILKRSGIELGRNTLAGWMLKCGVLVQPLINLLNDHCLSGDILQGDETPVQVLKEPGKSAQSQSYMWIRRGGLPDQKVVLYDYASSRSGRVAKQLFDGFRGYLQTDDYAGYHALGKTADITPLGCWAHARRKFVEAQKVATPKGKKVKAGKAEMALNYIGKLYGIERKIKEEAPDVRYQIRQQESLPVLEQLRTWLDKTLHSVLPKGALGKALGYLSKNWNKLTVYIEDGRLSIDNNAAENAIRPFVIGRKNWLFSDTPKGANASAALYSLIETAKANELEPYAYLQRVFKELPAAQSLEDIEALLPWNFDVQTLKRV
jgi:transposase